MKCPTTLLVFMFAVPCAGVTETAPEILHLVIEQRRPCTCAEQVRQGLRTEEFSACELDPEVRGTVLVIGGRKVPQVQRRDDPGSEWEHVGPRVFSERESNGLLHFATVLRIVYPEDDAPLEVLEGKRTGPVWVYTIRNVRGRRAVRVYVGDTAEYVRLNCVVDGAMLSCEDYLEV